MADRSSIDRVRSTVLALFPWLQRIGVTASGALGIRSAVSRLELEGGGPAVARVDDVAGYEYLQVVLTGGVVSAVILWRSKANGSASKWTAVSLGVGLPVDGVTTGTPITITTGSAKVFCG